VGSKSRSEQGQTFVPVIAAEVAELGLARRLCG